MLCECVISLKQKENSLQIIYACDNCNVVQDVYNE